MKMVMTTEVDLHTGRYERMKGTFELFSDVVKVPKWYAGKMSAQAASRIKRNHRNGIYSGLFYQRFFAKFGYEQNEVTWKRTTKE